MNIHVKLSFLMNKYTQCTTLRVHLGGLTDEPVPTENAPERLHASLSKDQNWGRGQRPGWGGTLLLISLLLSFVYNHKKINTSKFHYIYR